MVKPSNQATWYLKLGFAALILLIGSFIFFQPQFYETLFGLITSIKHHYDGYYTVQAWRQERIKYDGGVESLRRGIELARRYPEYLSAGQLQRELDEHLRQAERARLQNERTETVWRTCINILKEKAIQAIHQDLFVESELWHLFTQLENPNRPCSYEIEPHFLDAIGWRLGGAIRIKQGIVLRSPRRSGWGNDWVWAYDHLYYIDEHGNWQERGRITSPPEDVIREYAKVLVEWGQKTARLFNNRSHRLYQSQKYAAAKEVIQYALRLDPNYNLAWYNAAAYAALDNDAAKTIEFLRHYALPGRKLLSKVRLDPDFKKLLASHPEFRRFLYEQSVEEEVASEFLRSFFLELDWGRSIGCEEDVPGEGCEGFKEVHAELVLSRPQADPKWRLVLQEDTEESPDKIFIHMVDIGKRLFIVFKEVAYEVQLDPPGLTPLGGASLISDTNEGFPLVMARRDLDPQNPGPTWEITEHDGKQVIPYGYYYLPSSALKDPSPDELWFIEKGGQGFQIHDLVSGKVYPLVAVSDIKSVPKIIK